LALTRRQLLQLAPGPGPLDILEIGYGRGILLVAFESMGHRVTGIDRGALELRPTERLRARATIYPGQAEGAALPADSFDLIYGIHVVEHLADPAAVLAACHRWLRPGGLLYLITPNAQSAGLTVFRDRWWNLEDPTHARFFSPRSISLMLRRAGFAQARIRTPIWDSLTLEVSSLLRVLRLEPGEHGVLAAGAAWPIYGLLTPVALAARLAWPGLVPSMEVVARKRRPAGSSPWSTRAQSLSAG